MQVMRIGLPHALQDCSSYANGTEPAHDGGVTYRVTDTVLFLYFNSF
jgi:hypothetical protein